MKLFILSDPQKKMHWVVGVNSPANVAIPKKGALDLSLQVFGYCKTLPEAEVRMAKEKKKLTA